MIAPDRDSFALGGTDPLPALWAKFLRVEARLDAPGQPNDVTEEELGELNGIENQIIEAVPTSLAVAAVQINFLQSRMRAYAWCDLDDQIVANLIAGLERLAEQPPAP
jgi:hypothetical protein